MCEQAVVELPSSPTSPALARRFVSEHVGSWGLAGLGDDLTLPVSELVTNAMLHARTPTTVTVTLTGEFVEVSVRDSSPRPPVMRPVRLDLNADIDTLTLRLPQLPEDPRDPALHVGDAGSIAAGRGLHIVDAVADEWGVSELSFGKDVWFRVSTSGNTPVNCRCATDRNATSPGGLPLHLHGRMDGGSDEEGRTGS